MSILNNEKYIVEFDFENDNEDKKQNKKLFKLLILFLFTGILLISSSYAWFTSNRIVSVNSIDVNVQAEGGIELSVDGTSWKPMVTQEEIEDATTIYPTNTNQIPEKLEPVSTAGGVENHLLKMYFGLIGNNEEGDYVLSATRSIEERGTEGKFMAFDLFFKITKGGQVYFTPETYAKYLGENNEGVENALRVAFVDQGTVPVGTDLGTIQSLKNATNDDVYIWEPNSNTHSITGIQNAESVYGKTISENTTPLTYAGISNAIPESTMITLPNANATKYPGYFKNVDVDFKTQKNFTNNYPIWSFNPGITKMTVYIWLEGQDVDCENGSSSGDLEFRFQITTNPS